MKKFLSIIFCFLCMQAAMAQKDERTFFTVKGLATPVSVETANGTYNVYDQIEINGLISPRHATDANGNQVVVPQGSYKSGANYHYRYYEFSTLYNNGKSSAYSSKSNSNNRRTSKEERRERREERTRAAIEANWFSLGKAIDLGLPSGTIWAGYNLGAESALESGDFYTWGGTEPLSMKGSAAAENYFDLDNTLFSFGGRTRLTAEYDAAYQEWGGNWQIPTKADFEELLENCSWKQGKINGVKGFQGTGPNGKKIFFPVKGSCLDGQWDSELSGYWACELYNDGGTTKGGIMACVMWEEMEDNFYSAYPRYGFLQIRPVWKDTPVAPMTR